MSIRDEIDALPPLPNYPIQHNSSVEPYRTNRLLHHLMDENEAAFKRLAMAERLLHIAYDHLLSAGYEQDGPTLSDMDRYFAKREAE